MGRVRLGLLLAVMAVLVSACLAGANPVEGEDPAGFLMGLWHGVIAPVTFVLSLFTNNINLYEVNNSGNWYDFGFVLGAGILFGGGGAGARRKGAS